MRTHTVFKRVGESVESSGCDALESCSEGENGDQFLAGGIGRGAVHGGF